VEEKERKKWEVGASFKAEDFEVHVNVLRLFRPVYSIQITGSGASKFIRVNIEGQGKVTLKTMQVGDLSLLIRQAEAWILSDRQAREDEIIEERIGKETRFDGKGVKEPRKTGKTERNRERRKEKHSD
jgi:hypothetical protein